MSKLSPFQRDVAKLMTEVIPKEYAAIILPLTASYVKDSIVPDLAIFFTCS